MVSRLVGSTRMILLNATPKISYVAKMKISKKIITIKENLIVAFKAACHSQLVKWWWKCKKQKRSPII